MWILGKWAFKINITSKINSDAWTFSSRVRERLLKNFCLTKLIPVSLLMEKEKAAASKNKETDENKEQIINEDAIARGDNLRPW